jgi:hypothetical protein
MPYQPTGGRPGRPHGLPKVGGRKAGMPNKATIVRAEAMVEAIEARRLTREEIDAITPLGALLYILRVRLDAGEMHHAAQVASMAAPYMHAKLSSMDVKLRADITGKTDAELQAELDQLDCLLAAPTIEGEASIEVLKECLQT